MAHGIGGPRGSLFHVTRRARIRNLVLIRHGRGDKGEGVRTHKYAGNRDFDLRHVAGHSFAARRAILVMRVLRKHRFARTVPGAWPMAIEANLVGWFPELRVVLRAVHVVAVKARDPAPVHHAQIGRAHV